MILIFDLRRTAGFTFRHAVRLRSDNRTGITDCQDPGKTRAKLMRRRKRIQSF